MASQMLSPEELRRAAEAFEAALASLPEQACELQPYTARQLLARYVMERALQGQRDLASLRDEALGALATATAGQLA
jgi:hypothetical protein